MDTSSAALFDAILALETREECEKFLDDLLTRREITAFAKRWRTFCLLQGDWFTQREVQKLAKVSLGTVSRANRVLKYGTGTVRKIIQKLQK